MRDNICVAEVISVMREGAPARTMRKYQPAEQLGSRPSNRAYTKELDFIWLAITFSILVWDKPSYLHKRNIVLSELSAGPCMVPKCGPEVPEMPEMPRAPETPRPGSAIKFDSTIYHA